jgi:hypothetical protein
LEFFISLCQGCRWELKIGLRILKVVLVLTRL